ncbi:MAG: Mth938-like domain-containing protein [Gammaproteobacteria bacterium]|nr:Mth938-like domain-containing protein [Gammaproteobacteria bacterium]MDH3446686.1 Mth938-like domain-containing protein [Gammaproteobacteria bacterium]
MCTRLSTAARADGALIDGRIYIILKPMPLAEDIVTSRHRITAYSAQTVTVNEVVHRHSLVLTAQHVVSPWPVTSLADLSDDNLAPVLETKPAVVLLGTGARQRFPNARIFALFGQQGIGLEVMDNGALCRTFNILVAEDRAVTAAIILAP